ncbi:Rrf2 family transcriptional regulator [Sphingomonas sp. LB-2]|uniref:RrF2 family transcriptional regulator n=1 Tax=Sphingomonas caeni TaxID=2984949 RepID=UPI00223091AF|nr:Rrf2 family transcriptional regulator [Sphingomonas caeni]MCW3848001.1 Rrf2 family transcriptional regulator [Sphingomonas caeni]
MRLSSLADYAVVMMSAAARHCGVSGRLNATLIADETGLPLPTVQKLVSKLSAAGLIESARGTGGGFRLARPPATISLADIVEAIEGPIAMSACVESGKHDCCIEENCRVKPHMGAVNGAVRGALAGVSLASLSNPSPFASSEVEKPAPGHRFSTALETNGVEVEGHA